MKQQEVKRVDHAAEKAAKEEEKFAKLTRLEQELELMRREREAEKEAKRKKKEEERLARLERQRQKDVKKLKLDAELAAALDEYVLPSDAVLPVVVAIPLLVCLRAT